MGWQSSYKGDAKISKQEKQAEKKKNRKQRPRERIQIMSSENGKNKCRGYTKKGIGL